MGQDVVFTGGRCVCEVHGGVVMVVNIEASEWHLYLQKSLKEEKPAETGLAQ